MDYALLTHPDPDKRTHALEALRHQLEQPNVSIETDRDLVQALKPCVKSSNSLVSNHALAVLEPYFAALGGGEHHALNTLKYALTQLVPWEKLADAKPATRTSAARVVIAAAHASLLHSNAASHHKDSSAPWTLVEAGLKEHGFSSKNARAREQAVHILATLRANSTSAESTDRALPPLRPFTPLLLPLLADADPHVRAAALDSTIRIFTDLAVSDAARADLKKEMQRIGVAPKLQDQILAQVLGGGSQFHDRSPSSGGGSSSPSSVTTAAPAVHSSRAPTGNVTTSSTAASTSTSLPGGSAPTPSASTSTSAPDLAPVYIASERDLDAEFAAMRAGFEGRETEHNWTARDRSVARMRGMIVGGVTGRGDLCEAFVRNVRDVQEGIIKTASSLRTTVALSALSLISELAVALPPSPTTEHLLDAFLSHCLSVAGQTKKIVAAGSQATVTTLLQHSTLHLRTIQLVVALLNEKTASARQFGAQHVVTLLRVMRSTRSKTALDSSGGGTEVLAAAIGKGLVDANPQVRETSRVAFWEFDNVWPERAAVIAAGLDPSGRKLLDKAKSALQLASSAEPPAASGSVTSPVRATTSAERASHHSPTTASYSPLQTRSSGASKKPSVREAMMAARKKMLADKENGVPPHGQTGDFLEVGGESPLPPPVPAIPESPSSPSVVGRSTQLETPTRTRSPPLSRQTFSSAGNLSPRADNAPSFSSSSAETTMFSPSGHHDHVPESIVDDALRDQARQAELAAERLLELSLEEAEDNHQRVFSPGTATVSTGASATPQPERTAARTPGVVEAFSTPLPNPALKRFARAGGGRDSNLAAFEDSPDPRDATGAAAGRGGWWTCQRAETPSNIDPLGPQSQPEVTVSDEQRTGLAKLVADLCRADRPAGDPSAFRELSELSRKVPMRNDAAGATASALDPFAGFEDDVAEAQQPSVLFWREDRAFNKIYDRLETLLLRPEGDLTEPVHDAALRLMRDLVENQFACFVGAEANLFQLILKLRERPTRNSIAATEVVSTSFAARLEPVYGLGVLKPALSTYLSASETPTPGSFTLALRLFGNFLERLPGEVVEDVLPQWAGLVRRALDDADSGDLRRAAIMALVSAQSALASSAIAEDDDADGVSAQRLDELVGGLRPDQRSLIAYYIARKR